MDLTVFCPQYETFYTYTVTLFDLNSWTKKEVVNVFTPVGIGLEPNNDFKNVTLEKKPEVVNALTPVGSESSFSSKSSFS